MFPGDNGTELEGGRLRSGRRFWLGNTRRTVTKRRSCNRTGGDDYDLTSHLEGGSCNEEEEYLPLYEREEDEKSPDPKYEYDTHTTLRTSSEVRSRNSSPSGFVNQSNNSGGNRRQ